MLFGQVPVVRPERRRGAVLSAGVHLAVGLLVFGVARHQPAEGRHDSAPVRPPARMIWVPTDSPAAGGGGRGGGNRRPEPPRRAEAPGRDTLTVRPAPSVAPAPTPAPATEPESTVALSAEPLAAGLRPLAGVVDSNRSAEADSTGPGTGPGTDGHDGVGSGPGRGRGVGPGDDAEMGEVGTPGNGVSAPRLLRDVRPVYTADAMRARIAGTVGLSCVVDRDGRVRDCRLTRSLDPRYGLDLEAIRAAQRWQFAPGRRGADPVAVRVTIEMAFSLR